MKTRKALQFNLAPYFRNVRRSAVWAMLCLAFCIFGLGFSANAQNGHIIRFDVPARAQVRARAPSPTTSTTRGRSQDGMWTRAA